MRALDQSWVRSLLLRTCHYYKHVTARSMVLPLEVSGYHQPLVLRTHALAPSTRGGGGGGGERAAAAEQEESCGVIFEPSLNGGKQGKCGVRTLRLPLDGKKHRVARRVARIAPLSPSALARAAALEQRHG